MKKVGDSTNSRNHTSLSKTERATKWRADLAFVILILAWTIVVSIGCQFIVAYPMYWILGEHVSTPFWVLVYYLLDYGLSLALIFILPPYVAKLIARHRLKWRSKDTRKAVTSAKQSERSTSTLEQELKITPTELGVGHLPTFVDIGLAPVAYFVYAVLAGALTSLFSKMFGWFDANQTQNVGFGYFLSTGDRVFAMIAIILIAPIAEELIMRGWLYGKMRTRLKAPWAILIISLVFGMMHGQWNVGISTFVLSVILCSLREITGTIWSGMLLHIVSNGLAFYLLYIAIL